MSRLFDLIFIIVVTTRFISFSYNSNLLVRGHQLNHYTETINISKEITALNQRHLWLGAMTHTHIHTHLYT